MHCSCFNFEVECGCQVRLEDKSAIHSGIVCLNPKVLTFLGGLVQPLYEEWQMNQKYSGFSRSSLWISHDNKAEGPPPFEKLQIGAPSHEFVQQRKSSGQFSEELQNTSAHIFLSQSSTAQYHDEILKFAWFKSLYW